VEKLLHQVLEARSDASIAFGDLCYLLEKLGFSCRTRASHHIFSKRGVEEILNLQPRRGGSAKPYQIRQVRAVILKYRLGGRLDEQ
jgi:hypothetical protein